MTTKICPKCSRNVSFASYQWSFKSLPEDCPFCTKKAGSEEEKETGREYGEGTKRIRKQEVLLKQDWKGTSKRTRQ